MATQNKIKRLTEDQIEAIGNLLHEHVQFYDENGQTANNIVITEIERILTEEELAG